MHDFSDPRLGKANPYGVYDVAGDDGWVSVGTDHDTAAFARETIRRWHTQVGTPTPDRPLPSRRPRLGIERIVIAHAGTYTAIVSDLIERAPYAVSLATRNTTDSCKGHSDPDSDPRYRTETP